MTQRNQSASLDHQAQPSQTPLHLQNSAGTWRQGVLHKAKTQKYNQQIDIIHTRRIFSSNGHTKKALSLHTTFYKADFIIIICSNT